MNMKFINFIDGDCLNERDGELVGKSLRVKLRLCAPPNNEIFIANEKAEETASGEYEASVELIGYRNAVLAKNKTDGSEIKITLFRMPKESVNSFRISSDDNIIFLKDLTEKNYKSIFDNPYLAVYKKAHDLYGAKVHLNLFYEIDEVERSKFTPSIEYFNLTMVTDRYKEEFIKNSDWLKLAFHSNSDSPPRPYQDADAKTITEDCLKIYREIERFAGKSSISDSTTVHYGSGNRECIRALRALGLRSLTGYFTLREGKPRVSYYLEKELVEHFEGRDFWVDTAEDMIYARIDRVLNEFPNEENLEYLDALTRDPHRGGFISIMIHEQYFYKDYKKHLPDFEARVLDAAKLLYERGYKGMHMTDATREPHLNEVI